MDNIDWNAVIAGIIGSIISGFIILLLEYFVIQKLTRQEETTHLPLEDDKDKRRNLKIYTSILIVFVYATILLILINVIDINFAFFRYTFTRKYSQEFINTFVIVCCLSFLFFSLLINLRFPIKSRLTIISKLSVAINTYFDKLKDYWIIKNIRKLVVPIILVLILTSYSAYAAPEYFIFIEQIGDDEQITDELTLQIDDYLDRVGINGIVIKTITCPNSTCPIPESFLSDKRILVVVSGNIDNLNGDLQTIRLDFLSNCRRDPSPVDRKYREDVSCLFSETFKYDSLDDIKRVNPYLPIFSLNSLSTIQDGNFTQIELVNQAIYSLEEIRSISDPNAAWNIYEEFFYNVLYSIPNLTTKERIDSAGEILAKSKKLHVENTRIDYLTARWYEEAGVLNSNYYKKAIEKYQLLLKNDIRNSHLLNRLSLISKNLNRYADVFCYANQATHISASTENKLLLSESIEKLQLTQEDANLPTDLDITTLKETGRKIEETSETSSVEENFNLAETMLQTRNYREAIVYSNRIISSSNATASEKAGAHYLKARIYWDVSDLDNGISSLISFLDISVKKNFREENLYAGFGFLGQFYHSRGFHNESLAAYKNALIHTKKQTEIAATKSNIGSELAAIGENALGATFFGESRDEYLSIGLENIPIWERMKFYETLYDYSFLISDSDEKEKIYKAIINFYSSLIKEIEINASEDYNGCIWVSFQYHNNELVFEKIKSYIQEPIINSDYYRIMATVLNQLDRYSDVTTLTNEEIKLLTKSAKTARDFYTLAQAYQRIGKYTESLVPINKAIELDNPYDENDIADASDFYLLFIAYKNLGNQKDAIISLERAAAIESMANKDLSARYYTELGEYLNQSNDLELAIPAFEKAINYYNETIKANGENTSNLSGLAKCHKEVGFILADKEMLLTSVDYYHRATEVTRSNNLSAGYWFNIGVIYKRLAVTDKSYYSESISAWMNAIELDNPIETSERTDTDDVADWYMLAETYEQWSTIDSNQAENIEKSLRECLLIPIDSKDFDFVWRTSCQKMAEKYNIGIKE